MFYYKFAKNKKIFNNLYKIYIINKNSPNVLKDKISKENYIDLYQLNVNEAILNPIQFIEEYKADLELKFLNDIKHTFCNKRNIKSNIYHLSENKNISLPIDVLRKIKTSYECFFIILINIINQIKNNDYKNTKIEHIDNTYLANKNFLLNFLYIQGLFFNTNQYLNYIEKIMLHNDKNFKNNEFTNNFESIINESINLIALVDSGQKPLLDFTTNCIDKNLHIISFFPNVIIIYFDAYEKLIINLLNLKDIEKAGAACSIAINKLKIISNLVNKNIINSKLNRYLIDYLPTEYSDFKITHNKNSLNFILKKILNITLNKLNNLNQKINSTAILNEDVYINECTKEIKSLNSQQSLNKFKNSDFEKLLSTECIQNFIIEIKRITINHEINKDNIEYVSNELIFQHLNALLLFSKKNKVKIEVIIATEELVNEFVNYLNSFKVINYDRQRIIESLKNIILNIKDSFFDRNARTKKINEILKFINNKNKEQDINHEVKIAFSKIYTNHTLPHDESPYPYLEKEVLSVDIMSSKMMSLSIKEDSINLKILNESFKTDYKISIFSEILKILNMIQLFCGDQAQVYLYGSIVRDLILNKPYNEVNIIINCSPDKLIKKLKDLGIILSKKDFDDHELYIVHYQKNYYKIVFNEELNLESFSKLSFLADNSLFSNSKGEIFDPLGNLEYALDTNVMHLNPKADFKSLLDNDLTIIYTTLETSSHIDKVIHPVIHLFFSHYFNQINKLLEFDVQAYHISQLFNKGKGYENLLFLINCPKYLKAFFPSYDEKIISILNINAKLFLLNTFKEFDILGNFPKNNNEYLSYFCLPIYLKNIECISPDLYIIHDDHVINSVNEFLGHYIINDSDNKNFDSIYFSLCNILFNYRDFLLNPFLQGRVNYMYNSTITKSYNNVELCKPDSNSLLDRKTFTLS